MNLRNIKNSRCLGNNQLHSIPVTDRRIGTRQPDIWRIKRPCARDKTPFAFWAEHRQLGLRLTLGFVSTSKQITQKRPDIIFLSNHYHPLLQHITKSSLNIKNIRTSTVKCYL
jgi:hypothetical protein